MPTLVLDDGTILNENAATLQYIADLAPGKVAPVAGTVERSILQNALSYISGEVHGSIGPLFNPTISAEVILVKGIVTFEYFKLISTCQLYF